MFGMSDLALSLSPTIIELLKQEYKNVQTVFQNFLSYEKNVFALYIHKFNQHLTYQNFSNNLC